MRPVVHIRPTPWAVRPYCNKPKVFAAVYVDPRHGRPVNKYLRWCVVCVEHFTNDPARYTPSGPCQTQPFPSVKRRKRR